MAESNESRGSKLKRSSRGTTDDIEIMRAILEEDPILLRKVREKIKLNLANSKVTAVDRAKTLHDAKKD